VSSIISIIGILIGATKTVQPIQDQTYPGIGFVSFLCLFLFRMLSWIILMTMLHSFAIFVMVKITRRCFFATQNKLGHFTLGVSIFVPVLITKSCFVVTQNKLGHLTLDFSISVPV
jgi:type III secretory pathway component EscS